MRRFAHATMALAFVGLLIILPSLVVACGGNEAGAQPTAKETEDEIREVEQERLRALVEGDVEAARELHAENFELTTPTGELLSKDEYLEALGGGLDYVVFEPISPIRVRVRGDRAVVTYRSKIGFAGNFGGTTEQSHKDTYEQQDGEWLIVRSVTTGSS